MYILYMHILAYGDSVALHSGASGASQGMVVVWIYTPSVYPLHVHYLHTYTILPAHYG